MRTTTLRRSLAALLTPLTLGVGWVVSDLAPAAAGGDDPAITRIDLGSGHDAEMLAPDGAGKVWFSLPGTQTYGYVSGGAVTTLTNEGSDRTNSGEIAVLSGTPYLWADVAFDDFMFGPMGSVSILYTGSTGDIETSQGGPASNAMDAHTFDMAARPGVGVWSTIRSNGSNYGYLMGHGAPCASAFCGTSDDPEYEGVTIDDDGFVWGSDSAAQWDGTENIRKATPGSVAPSLTEFTVSSKVGKLAWSGNSLYGTVPGQSVLRQIIPGTAPNVTEIDYGVSGVVGDVETDGDGNIWFSLAGQSKLGVLRNGAIQEFSIPAPAVRLAFDASTDRLWWSESGTAKVAHLHVATTLDAVFPTTTTTTTATTTTTTAPPTTTTTTAPPAPRDTTAPTAPVLNTTLRVDARGRTNVLVGPASEPMAMICELKVAGRRIALGGTLIGAGTTRALPLELPARLRPRRSTAAVLACGTFDIAGNVGTTSTTVTLTR